MIVHTVVFEEREGGGNPCPVVLDAGGWDTARMQAAAAQLGHETAFVLDDGGDVRLRYFVPRHEMEMCVHATIAATVVLARRGREVDAVLTPLGRLRVSVDADAGTALVDQFPPVFDPPLEDPGPVLAALGTDALAGPVQAVSVSRAKLMVPLEDERALDALRPDIPALWDECRRLGVTGAYPFTRAASGADAAARQFPVDAGYDEDPATGVAACALGAHLAQGGVDGWKRFAIAQGRAMGRPSIITAEALVAGGAITAARVGGGMRVQPS